MKDTGRARPFRLYLVSDDAPDPLEHFMAAVLNRFPQSAFEVTCLPFLANEAALLEALEGHPDGAICYSVSRHEVRDRLVQECARRKIPLLDVTGCAVQFLETVTGTAASTVPRPLHAVDADYLGRMAAVEFTMQHDDNRRLDELHRAEIIIVGVSRVSKSPTAIYLGYRGFRVANVSLVRSHGLPPELDRHRRKNVVGLTLEPRRLAEIRQRRFARWKLGNFDYTTLSEVRREVFEAEGIYRRKGWPIIDTTHRPVEETSSLILQALGLTAKALY